MSRSQLLALPTAGTGWSFITSTAAGSWGTPNLGDQNAKHGVKALAGALVYARTGDAALRTRVRDAIAAAMGTEMNDPADGALAWGRQIGSYVFAADLIDLRSYAPSLDASFRTWLAAMRTREDPRGHSRWVSMVVAHEDAGNNQGSFSGATLVVIDRYLGDTTDLARRWAVFRGFMGDRSAFNDFRGQDEKNSALYATERVWSCDASPSAFVPVNPACTIAGVNLDGAIVGDIYRDGLGLVWPVGPTGVSYTLESLQALVVQTEMLSRAGYPAYATGDQALRRIADVVTRNGAAGGAGWNQSSVSYHVPWLLNARYGTSYPTRAAQHGRLFGYTDWLYGGA